MIPYHDTLDVSLIEMMPDSKFKVVFVTGLPFKRTISYEQGTVNRGQISELYISGPTKDTPLYHGYVKFAEPVNPPASPWDPPRQEQPDKDLCLLLRFTMSGSIDEGAAIEFPVIGCSVDIFDEHRLYFTADRNTIRARGQTFNNSRPATDRTQNSSV